MREAQAQIRVAYLIGQYPAANHTFILREVRSLRALGVDVRAASILTPDRAPELMTETEREELAQTFYVKPSAANVLNVFGTHLKTFAARPASYLRGLAYALKLSLSSPGKTLTCLLYFVEAVTLGRWMEREKLTHVHSHFTSTVCLVALKVFPRLKMSMTIHGPAEFDDAVGFRLAEKIEAATFVCAISDYARSQLMRHSDKREWGKIEVARLGIDPGVFAPRPPRENPSPFEIVCVGRLAPVKAQHVLVAAVDRLVKDGRDVRLRLVGDGEDREELERNVAARGLENQVVFEGWRNQDEVLRLYERADAFALASFAEGVPVVLMEAMAMEIPCVATHVNGIPELVEHEVSGLLVPPSDEEALAGALARLMDDAPLRRRLGAQGRRRVEAMYNLERNAAQLAGVFRRRVGAGEKVLPGVAAKNDETARAVS